MRLIDADAILNKFEWKEDSPLYIRAIRAAIEAEPTIDAVPVIRCKDCKWCVEHYDTDGNVPYWVCKNWYGGTDSDGYCYEAERKES